MVDSNVGKRSFPDSFDGTFVKSFAPQEARVRRTDRQKNVFWLCRNALSVRMLGTSVCAIRWIISRASQALRFCSRLMVYAQSLRIACRAAGRLFRD